MRARCSRVERYLAAPIARVSSRFARTPGTVSALSVPITAVTHTSSTSEYPRGEALGQTRGTTEPSPHNRLALLGRVVGLRRRDDDLGLQLEEVLLADTADVHQLLDFLERAVLLAVLDDARGGLRADAGQRLELGRRCAVDVDGARYG